MKSGVTGHRKCQILANLPAAWSGFPIGVELHFNVKNETVFTLRLILEEDKMNIAPEVSDTDPFYDQYVGIVPRILGEERPATQELLWSAIQTLYDYNPSSFTLVAGFHQDAPSDTLHFNVKVKLWSSHFILKFHGYWKAGFHCSHVECMEGNEPPSQIATFQ